MGPMKHWKDFDGIDLPSWMDEELGTTVCSFLNSYIPKEYSTHGTRYHLLNHFRGGLFFHLLNRPRLERECQAVNGEIEPEIVALIAPRTTESPIAVKVKYPSEVLKVFHLPSLTFWEDGKLEEWRIVRRDFEGIRAEHGPYVEWPILRPITKALVFADYNFNGEHSMPFPNARVPLAIREYVRGLLEAA